MSFPNMQVARYQSRHAHAYGGSSFTFHKPGQVLPVGRTLHPHPSLPVDEVQLEEVHDGGMRVGREKPRDLHHRRAQPIRGTHDKIVLAQVVPQLPCRPLPVQQSRPPNGFLPLPLRVSI